MKALNLVFCSCKRYLESNEWKPYKEAEDLITTIIRKEHPKAKVSIPNLELPVELKDKRINTAIVTTKDKEFKLAVGIKLSRCVLCSREGGNYFEAILQVRSANQQVLEEGIQYLQDRVHNLRNRGMFINRVERFEDGFDLFMTNRRVTQMLGKELQEFFGGKLKASPRLFSQNRLTSKKIFRVNVFVELPGFTREDIIVVNDKVCVVDKIGKKIKLRELQTDGGLVMDYDKMDYRVLHKQQTYVSRAYPSLEVINPLDFQSSMVKNKPKKAFTPGQTINVVIHKGIYAVD
jgi:nonsense-mediated mRNA decay protein 3